MNIGILTVNGFDFHPNGRFLEEAKELGHCITLINPRDLCCAIAEDGQGILLDGVLSALPDMVMPRQGAPMGQYGFVLLRQLEGLRIPLVNSRRGVALAKHQFFTLQRLAAEKLPVIPSCFVTREKAFFLAVQHLGGYPVVVKQVDGMGGDGVAKLETAADAIRYFGRMLNPDKGMVVQAFVPPEGRTDIRILVVGDSVAGAMALTPAPGQFRANIHQNGCARAFEAPPLLAGIAISAAKACQLEIAGVDMMVDKQGQARVVEVNYSPGFRGLEQATRLNIARQILVHACAVADSQRS